MAGVKGIILDSSLLLPSDDGDSNGDAALCSGADYLLQKLRYSEIPTGISHEQGLSSQKEFLLQEIARKYHCTILCLSREYDISSAVARIWEDKSGNILYVVSSCGEALCYKGNSSGWLKVIVGPTDRESSYDAEYIAATGVSTIFIHKLEELLLLICHLSKKTIGKEALAVGYVMKPSREEDFAKRGAFPLCPTQNGLIFLPLNFELPLSAQLQLVDAVLHKATDEILAVDMGSSEIRDKVTFTEKLQELQRSIKFQPNCCVIDPFENIFPILDRLEIQRILTGLGTLNIQGRRKIRAPHFLKVDSFDEPNLEQSLAEAKLSLPNIVKPQVACGVTDAHSMNLLASTHLSSRVMWSRIRLARREYSRAGSAATAHVLAPREATEWATWAGPIITLFYAIVFKANHYKDLNVPLPAVVQEYVDHSSVLYKFYALGSKVYYAVKKSIPNADTLMNLFAEKGLKPLHFDSLKSLPVAKEQMDADNHRMDIELVTDAAAWLRRKLGLTIFGFDVVVQEGTGDHVIVDVNYLPSFKEVPDDVAIPAFWDAIKEKIVSVE